MSKQKDLYLDSQSGALKRNRSLSENAEIDSCLWQWVLGHQSNARNGKADLLAKVHQERDKRLATTIAR